MVLILKMTNLKGKRANKILASKSMITNDDTAVANTLTVSTKTWKYACFGTVKAMISQRTFCKGNIKDYVDSRFEISKYIFYKVQYLK